MVESLFGGHRPPLQMAICKTTLKLQIHAVATGVDRRKNIYHPALRDHPTANKRIIKILISLIEMCASTFNRKRRSIFLVK